VLLDELEKAHGDVSNILLQIMEEGELTDATGRKVSFKNAIVVMTSNVGGQIKGDGLGFQPSGNAEQCEGALRQLFQPEFLGRLDKIVAFRRLTDDALETIATKYLTQLHSRLEVIRVELRLPEQTASWLAKQCRAKDGARHLRRLVQERIEGPLAEFLLRSGKRSQKVEGFFVEDALAFRNG
jgi:ATP-dependent Clp protease ATP-binding subunit ClpA